jgi:hypothetical protein
MPTEFTYLLKVTFFKMIKYFVAFLLPVLVNQFIVNYPEVAQLTVGAIILGILNWLKMRMGVAGGRRSWVRFIP